MRQLCCRQQLPATMLPRAWCNVALLCVAGNCCWHLGYSSISEQELPATVFSSNVASCMGAFNFNTCASFFLISLLSSISLCYFPLIRLWTTYCSISFPTPHYSISLPMHCTLRLLSICSNISCRMEKHLCFVLPWEVRMQLLSSYCRKGLMSAFVIWWICTCMHIFQHTVWCL